MTEIQWLNYDLHGKNELNLLITKQEQNIYVEVIGCMK